MALLAYLRGVDANASLKAARTEGQLAREAEAKAKDALTLASKNAADAVNASSKAQVNQDMALNFANSTVHELSDLTTSFSASTALRTNSNRSLLRPQASMIRSC